MWLLSTLAFLFTLSGVSATPFKRAATPVSTADLSSLAPYTRFALAAYCPTSKLAGWNCGEACRALPGFQPTLIGGDGNVIQIYFVGYWPAQNTIVVAHEGTDPTKLVSVLSDLNVFQDPLDTKLFPGVPSSVRVHDGFRNAHALTAPKILAEVKSLMASKGTNRVTVIGHSLGGALAQLDALYFSIHLPADTSIKAVTYGVPRVGNAAFASLLDSKIPDLRRINNRRDLVPIVPGRLLGYAHPQGEIHILSNGNAVACSGQDNSDDSKCQIKTVPTILSGNILDHLGPYEGINIGTIFCV